ncbi:hypothetical protein, partial [Nocardia brasiliensis]|uniref:hypothetical protein n=1 Tax=Nocardia brasiliensis TaxID=37326 RepID=UPI00245882FB
LVRVAAFLVVGVLLLIVGTRPIPRIREPASATLGCAVRIGRTPLAGCLDVAVENDARQLNYWLPALDLLET